MSIWAMQCARGSLILMVLSVSPLAQGESSRAKTTSPGAVGTEGDNSKINQRDRSATEPTADQQRDDKTDLETTRKIRSALTDDKSLSTYAHNIKIITRDGSVVLKGPVRSTEEKKQIESTAARVAGKYSVKNELEVTPE